MSKYQLIAKNRTFCEGTLAECQETLTGISNMMEAGFATDYQIEDFLITIKNKEENV